MNGGDLRTTYSYEDEMSRLTHNPLFLLGLLIIICLLIDIYSQGKSYFSARLGHMSPHPGSSSWNQELSIH